MNVTRFVGPRDVEAALTEADTVAIPELSGHLNAPVDASLMGQVDEAWSFVRQAIAAAADHGKAGVQDAVDTAWSGVEAVLQRAGQRARLVEDSIRDRLRVYTSKLLERALLSYVESEIQIGDLTMGVDNLEFSRSIQMEASLKLAITGIADFSGSGSFEVKVSYAIRE